MIVQLDKDDPSASTPFLPNHLASRVEHARIDVILFERCDEGAFGRGANKRSIFVFFA
jgi:hypothetical protein